MGQPTVPVGGGPEVPLHAVVAPLLQGAVTQTRDEHGGRPPSGLVLTYPEGWSARQVGVLVAAAGAIGFAPESVWTVSEPVAAAQYYGWALGVHPGEWIAVIDFGGATLDVTVLVAESDGLFHVVMAQTDGVLGGRTLDAVIRAWVDRALASHDPELLARLRSGTTSALELRAVDESIRHAKEQLSEASIAGITIDVGDERENLALTRSEFDELIYPEVDQAVRLARMTFDMAGLRGPADLRAICLAGGTARIPLVQAELGTLGPVEVIVDPETAAARGALQLFAGEVPPEPVRKTRRWFRRG